MPSYTNGGVIVDAVDPLTAGALAAEIGSIVSVDIPTNVETVSDDSGSIYDEGHALTQFSPMANVTTKSLAEVFSVLGVAGQCFIDGVGAPGVSVFAKNRGDCLTDVEADDHTEFLFANGLMTLGTLQADRGADATLSFSVDGITDGSNAPLQISHGVTLPSTLAKGQWELAIASIAGIEFKPLSATVSFNTQKEKPRGLAPTIWADRIAVSKVQPLASLRGIDPSIIGSAGIDVTGVSATHANTLLQFVKRQSGASYAAAGAGTHIAMTLAGVVVVTNPFSAQGQGDGTVDIEIRTLHDGTNVPVLINIAANYDSTPTT